MNGVYKARVTSALYRDQAWHEQFGYYGQGVSVTTAVLPDGWRDRVVPFDRADAGPSTAVCLDAHDLVVSKLVAGLEKDLLFAAALIDAQLVDGEPQRPGARRLLRCRLATLRLGFLRRESRPFGPPAPGPGPVPRFRVALRDHAGVVLGGDAGHSRRWQRGEQLRPGNHPVVSSWTSASLHLCGAGAGCDEPCADTALPSEAGQGGYMVPSRPSTSPISWSRCTTLQHDQQGTSPSGIAVKGLMDLNPRHGPDVVKDIDFVSDLQVCDRARRGRLAL